MCVVYLENLKQSLLRKSLCTEHLKKSESMWVLFLADVLHEILPLSQKDNVSVHDVSKFVIKASHLLFSQGTRVRDAQWTNYYRATFYLPVERCRCICKRKYQLCSTNHPTCDTGVRLTPNLHTLLLVLKRFKPAILGYGWRQIRIPYWFCWTGSYLLYWGYA